MNDGQRLPGWRGSAGEGGRGRLLAANDNPAAHALLGWPAGMRPEHGGPGGGGGRSGGGRGGPPPGQ